MASSGGFAPSAPPPQTPAPAPAHGGSSRLASSHLAVPSSSSSPFSSSSSSSTSLSHTATHPSIQFASRSPSVASASSPRSVDGPPTLVPADAPSACHAGPSPSPSSNSAPSLAQRKHQRSSPSVPSQSSPAPPLPSPCPSTAAPPAATDAPPSPADLPPIGSLIVSQSGSQYILTQKKGQGSFSTVYVATCIEPPSITRFRTRKSLVKEEVLAIKCVARLQQSPTVQVRRECQLLELLQAPSAASALPGSYVKTSQISDATMENDSEGCGHEGVVHMFEVFETPDFLFLVLEFCQIDLYQFVVDNGGFPTHVVKRIFTQLIDAVDFCHTRGVFHRDIKPENVLVNTSDCSIRLTDFGLATQEPWSYEVGVGSLRYMSPECFGIELHTIQGRRPTPGDDPLDPNLGAARRPGFASAPNDVWSLGIVLINLLYSRNPWRSPADPFCSEAYLRDRLPVLQTHFAISHELDAFLRRCFDAVPERRATVRQLRRLFSGVKDLVDPIAAVALGLGAMPVVRDLLPAVATSRSGAAGDGLAAFAFGILAGKNGSSGTSRDEKEKKRAAERKKRTAASAMSVDVNDMNGEFIPSASTMSASSSSSSSASSSSSDGDNPFQSRSVRGSRGGGSFIGPSGVLFDVSPAEPGVQAFPPLFTPQDAQPNRRFSSVFPAPNLDRRRSNSSLGISSHALPQPNNSVGNKVSSLAQLLRDARPQQIAPSHYFDPNSPPTSTLASPLPSPLPYRGGAAGASFGAWDGTLFSVEDSFRTSMITPPPRLDPTTPLTPLRRVSLGDALLIAGRRSSTSTDGRNPYGGADPRLAAVAAAAAAASSAGLFGPVSPSEEEPPVYSRPLPAMNPKGSVHRRFSKIEPQPAAAHQHLPFTLAIPVPKFRQRQQPLPHPGPPRLASEDSALAPPLMSKSLTPDLEDSTSTATQAGSPFSASPSTLSPASTRSQDRRASASSSLQTLSPYRVAATRSPVISTTPAFPFPPAAASAAGPPSSTVSSTAAQPRRGSRQHLLDPFYHPPVVSRQLSLRDLFPPAPFGISGSPSTYVVQQPPPMPAPHQDAMPSPPRIHHSRSLSSIHPQNQSAPSALRQHHQQQQQQHHQHQLHHQHPQQQHQLRPHRNPTSASPPQDPLPLLLQDHVPYKPHPVSRRNTAHTMSPASAAAAAAGEQPASSRDRLQRLLEALSVPTGTPRGAGGTSGTGGSSMASQKPLPSLPPPGTSDGVSEPAAKQLPNAPLRPSQPQPHSHSQPLVNPSHAASTAAKGKEPRQQQQQQHHAGPAQRSAVPAAAATAGPSGAAAGVTVGVVAALMAEPEEMDARSDGRGVLGGGGGGASGIGLGVDDDGAQAEEVVDMYRVW